MLHLYRTVVRLRSIALHRKLTYRNALILIDSCFRRSAFVIALIIAVCYSLLGDSDIGYVSNSTDKSIPTLKEDMELSTNFFTLFPLVDEKENNWTLPELTEGDLTEAIGAGKEALGDKEILEELILAPAVDTPTYRHQRGAVSTSHTARIASKRGYVEDYATKFLAKKFNNKRSHDKRRDVGRGPSSKLENQKDFVCGEPLKYRSFDGSCNNRKNARWGSSLIPFRRALNPDYCDGISSPRCSNEGKELASARQISLTVHRPSYYTDPHFTVMLAVWGQFLDHDITATASSQGQDGEPIECCNVPEPKHPECFPVPLGRGDPYFDDYNVTCMNFVRSAPAPTNRLGPREQLNQGFFISLIFNFFSL